jgi:hypothetical protein
MSKQKSRKINVNLRKKIGIVAGTNPQHVAAQNGWIWKYGNAQEEIEPRAFVQLNDVSQLWSDQLIQE